jgi:hypothetical protein
MKYFKTFAPIMGIFTLALIGIMITSPDASTAGQKSSGIIMMMFGAGLVWFILEFAAIGKKEPEPTDQKKD